MPNSILFSESDGESFFIFNADVFLKKCEREALF